MTKSLEAAFKQGQQIIINAANRESGLCLGKTVNIPEVGKGEHDHIVNNIIWACENRGLHGERRKAIITHVEVVMNRDCQRVIYLGQTPKKSTLGLHSKPVLVAIVD